MCANSWKKQTTLTFLAQIFPKMNLGLEIQRTNVKIRINILELVTMCANFQARRTTMAFWVQICPEMDFGVGISKI